MAQPGAGRHVPELEVVLSPLQPVTENLDLDESMTRAAAAERRVVLRIWWGSGAAVVMGRSERVEQVANLEECRRLGIEILRRSSGGGTVLQTSTVLNYSLTAPAPAMFDIRSIFSMGARMLVGALARLGVEACPRGISDVAVADRKISGNAMARRWGGLLLHGTLLYDLDFDLVESCLRHPPREPDYRGQRSHRDFLTTLMAQGVSCSREELEAVVAASARRLWTEGSISSLLFTPS